MALHRGSKVGHPSLALHRGSKVDRTPFPIPSSGREASVALHRGSKVDRTPFPIPSSGREASVALHRGSNVDRTPFPIPSSGREASVALHRGSKVRHPSQSPVQAVGHWWPFTEVQRSDTLPNPQFRPWGIGGPSLRFKGRTPFPIPSSGREASVALH